MLWKDFWMFWRDCRCVESWIGSSTCWLAAGGRSSGARSFRNVLSCVGNDRASVYSSLLFCRLLVLASSIATFHSWKFQRHSWVVAFAVGSLATQLVPIGCKTAVAFGALCEFRHRPMNSSREMCCCVNCAKVATKKWRKKDAKRTLHWRRRWFITTGVVCNYFGTRFQLDRRLIYHFQLQFWI